MNVPFRSPLFCCFRFSSSLNLFVCEQSFKRKRDQDDSLLINKYALSKMARNCFYEGRIDGYVKKGLIRRVRSFEDKLILNLFLTLTHCELVGCNVAS